MAAKDSTRKILVYAHWEGLKGPSLMGVLSPIQTRGKEIFSFEYSEDWLRSGNAQQLDPDLELYSGLQYIREGKKGFGIFLDSAPDRWGRLLMQRREAALARQEGRREKTLMETDYLLGVFDEARMGALRFKEDASGPFLNNNKEQAVPPWAFLRELENASLELEQSNAVDTPEYFKWLNLLLAPGSSLGGARPKASVYDATNNLWIAKFPSRKDDKDIGGWEMTVHKLAADAGLFIPHGVAMQLSSPYHTFLTRRFDRTGVGGRIHFASAMTLLGYSDGVDYHAGVSYLELAKFLIQHGARVDRDLEELWRRIVFNICIKNTDDHLRNHGFLLTREGWILSPAYDMNPDEKGTGLSLNISETDNALDLDLAREVAEYFRLSELKADKIIRTVKTAVAQWRFWAEKYKIPRAEQERMARAFLTD